ncbi:MAG: hypothetical protein GF353_14895, partial [Candidatus Lokiarchaeota archaeon]|nr:hypothetical protein [Candidatus Lokiarchaeota archaeon]
DIAAEILESIFQKYDKSIPIICHLDGGYLKALERANEQLNRKVFYTEIADHLTSRDSLRFLEGSIREALDNSSLEGYSGENNILYKTWERKISKIVDYQFGKGEGRKLIGEGIKTRKNHRINQITIFEKKSNIKLGTLKKETGNIQLTIEGASKLVPFDSNAKIIVFDGDKIRGNTLFRPGILDYYSEFSPKDSVIILNRSRSKVVAVGQMIVGSPYIKNTHRGRVAKIYEKIK